VGDFATSMIDLTADVDSPVARHRDTDAMVFFDAQQGRCCDVCESGEVTQPFQTCAYPMFVKCLRCGNTWDTVTEGPL